MINYSNLVDIDNSMVSEIRNTYDKLANNLSIKLETIFQTYRNFCTSDMQFAHRMWLEQKEGQPNVTQYCFDGRHVFYTVTEYNENKITVSIKQGSAW